MTVGMLAERGVRYAVSLVAIAAVVDATSTSRVQLGWIGWDDRGGTWFQVAPGAPSTLTNWTGTHATGALFDPLKPRIESLPSSLRLQPCEPRS